MEVKERRRKKKGGRLKNSAGSHRAPALADASSTQFSLSFSRSRQQHTTHTHTGRTTSSPRPSRELISKKYTRCFTSTHQTSPPKHQRFSKKKAKRKTPEIPPSSFVHFLAIRLVLRSNFSRSSKLRYFTFIWNKSARASHFLFPIK